MANLATFPYIVHFPLQTKKTNWRRSVGNSWQTRNMCNVQTVTLSSIWHTCKCSQNSKLMFEAPPYRFSELDITGKKKKKAHSCNSETCIICEHDCLANSGVSLWSVSSKSAIMRNRSTTSRTRVTSPTCAADIATNFLMWSHLQINETVALSVSNNITS